MELICPHCRQRITIAEALAGQTATCPKCGGPFTAPLLPPPAASMRPEAPHPQPASVAAASGLETLAAPFSASSESECTAGPSAAGDLRPRRAVVLQSSVVRWIAPVCLVLNFLLLFFPWVGVYPGGSMLARQSGAGIAFGLTPTRLDEKILQKIADPSPDALLILYFLLMLLALPLVGVLVVHSFGPPDVKEKLGDKVTQLLPWRSMAIAVVSALAFLFVELHHLFINFPIENAAASAAPAVLDEAIKAAKAPAADILFLPLMYRTAWFSLVVSLNWLALLASLTELWLERRGSRPPPCLLLEW